MRMIVRLVTPLILLVMAGCVAIPEPLPMPTMTPSSHGMPSQWQLSGKMASKGMLGSATFQWQQIAADSHIDLRGPLGMGAVRIDYANNQLVLDGGDWQLAQGQAEAWLAQQGLAVPYQAFRYWVTGKPAPGIPSEQQAAGQFVQMGWRIAASDWKRFHGVELPTKMQVSSDTVHIKMARMSWDWEKPLGLEFEKPWSTFSKPLEHKN